MLFSKRWPQPQSLTRHRTERKKDVTAVFKVCQTRCALISFLEFFHRSSHHLVPPIQRCHAISAFRCLSQRLQQLTYVTWLTCSLFNGQFRDIYLCSKLQRLMLLHEVVVPCEGPHKRPPLQIAVAKQAQ